MRATPLLFVLCALSAGRAAAAERVMVIINERVADVPTTSPIAETHLSELLIAGGQQVTEAVETEQARRTISVDKLLRGTVGAEISALNCDVLVVGRTDTVIEEIPYGVTSVAAVSTEWTVRAVAIDTGRVLVSASGTTTGSGNQNQAAGTVARRKAAAAMFDALALALQPSAPAGAVSLTVTHLQELADADTIKRRLAALDGVRSVTVRFVSADETRIDVDLSRDTWAFAAMLKSIGLEIAQLSRGAVTAKWTPWGAGKSLAIAAFLNETGIDRNDWIEAMLPDVFATELANSRYLRIVSPTTAPTLGPDFDDDPQALALAVKRAGSDMLAFGSLQRIGPQLRLSVTAYGTDGRAITAAQVFASEAELVNRTRDLVWALDARLFERLFAKGSLAAYAPVYGKRQAHGLPAPTDPSAPAASVTGSVRVVEVKLDDLFPSRLTTYATRPVGKIVLSNPGARAATGVRVRVDIPGVTSAPAVLKVDDLAPGAEREVPIALMLDRARMQALTENTPAQAEIALSWNDGVGAEGTDVFTVPLVVFDKNALDWSEPEAIAAFITHKDASLDALARGAERQGRASLALLPDALRVPFVLFEALGATGVQYQADARNPFGVTSLDTVAFPAETLARRAGDCDDLSVLMAALLESQGVATSFVLTPGHVFIAWSSGVKSRDAARLGLPVGASIDRGGEAWIPLEVTRVGEPFGVAVMSAAAEVRRHEHDAANLRFVDVAEAWRRFPPFPASFAKVEPTLPTEFADRLAQSARHLAALGADAGLGAASAPGDSSDPNELNRVGVRLVERGQWRRAVGYLERAHSLAAERHDIEYNLANLRVVQGNMAEARAIYHALSDVPALAAASLHGLGVLAYLDGDTRDARKLFERSGLPEAKDALARLGLDKNPKPASRPKARKPVPPPPDPFLGIRAGVQRVPIDELLLWLR